MKAFVLGLDHAIQYTDDHGYLKALLHDLHANQHFDLIVEEWGASEDFASIQTIGEAFSDSPENKILWRNIEMPHAIQEAIGIREALRLRSHPGFDEWTGVTINIPSTKYLKRADDQRERYWVGQIVETLPHESVLVICGLIHVDTVAEKLQSAGFRVEKKSLCECDWYRTKHLATCTEVEKKIVDENY